MANSITEITTLATAIARLAQITKAYRAEIRDVLDYNSAIGIDWSTAHTILGTADADADISASLEFSPNEVSNSLFSLSQLANVWDNAAATQGDHGGNLLKLTSPKKHVLLISESNN